MAEIIKKYYGKSGRLKILDKFRKEEPIFRFKLQKNGKEVVCCDFHGNCTNMAYVEAFPGAIKKGRGWCYLCRKHYYSEEKRLNWKLPVCSEVEW